MVREVVRLELDDEKIKLLGEEGAIAPLLEMASRNIESKEVSLHALVKLSTFGGNKSLIARGGGARLVLKLLSSPHMLPVVVARCAEILANLSSNGDGTKVPRRRRRCSPRAGAGDCKSAGNAAEHQLVQWYKDSGLTSPSRDLPIRSRAREVRSQEIRELAINLLFLFSQHEPEGVVEHLLKPRRLEALVGFLESSEKGDVQKSQEFSYKKECMCIRVITRPDPNRSERPSTRVAGVGTIHC